MGYCVPELSDERKDYTPQAHLNACYIIISFEPKKGNTKNLAKKWGALGTPLDFSLN